MEKIRRFVLEVLEKEAAAWTAKGSNDLNHINSTIDELYSYAIPEARKCFGINKQKRLRSGTSSCTGDVRKPRTLFKISRYQNDELGDIYAAYLSINDPRGDKPGITEAYYISCQDENMRIIGSKMVVIDDLTLEPSGWKASVYNHPGLDISQLDSPVEVDRYIEPDDDGFSREEYYANS